MSRSVHAQNQKRSTSASIAAWFGRLPLESRLVLLVCVIALVLRLLPVGGVSTDYDEGVYWQSLRAMSNGYPLFTSVFSSQPPFFLLSLYPLYSFFGLFFGQTLVAARLGIVVYSVIGLIAIYFAGRSIGGRWVGLLALALLAADPFYLKESYTLQAEVPALAWQLVALALAVAAMRSSGRARRLLAFGSGVALGLGVLTKLFDVFVVLPMLCYLLMPVANAWDIEGKRLRFRGRATLLAGLRAALPDIGLLIAGALLAFLVVLLPFAGHLGIVYDQVIRYHLAAGQHATNGLGYNVRLLASDATEYLLVALAFVGTVVAIRQRNWAVIPLLLWAVACFGFLLRQQPLLDHDRILLVPPLVLLASLIAHGYRRAEAIAPKEQRMRAFRLPETAAGRALLLLTTGVILITLLIGGAVTRRDVRTPLPESTVEMASALRAATIPGDLVASDDQYIAGLADRNTPPQLVDTSLVRIQSGYLTASQLESIITQDDIRVILFASGRFKLVPGFSAWVQANFTKIADFGDGRALYQKVPQGPQPV